MTNRVAALYVETDTVYRSIPGVDCWDINRDARLYRGPFPVVAHPPCNSWGAFRTQRNETMRRGGIERDRTRIDQDAHSMSCGPIAVDQVRQFGGVLEHPANSFLWRYAALPAPGDSPDVYGGFSIEIEQGWFGHPCPKRTWLYCCGPMSPLAVHRLLPEERPAAMGRVEKQWSTVRMATPPSLARWMVDLAESLSKSERASA